MRTAGDSITHSDKHTITVPKIASITLRSARRAMPVAANRSIRTHGVVCRASTPDAPLERPTTRASSVSDASQLALVHAWLDARACFMPVREATQRRGPRPRDAESQRRRLRRGDRFGKGTSHARRRRSVASRNPVHVAFPWPAAPSTARDRAAQGSSLLTGASRASLQPAPDGSRGAFFVA